MSASIKSLHVGIIAENQSDVDVVQEFISKYIESNFFSLSKVLGKGKSRIINKTDRLTKVLIDKGVDLLLVCIDKDDDCEKELSKTIEKNLNKVGAPATAIIIPIQAIEAWLLADRDAIRATFNITKKLNIPNSEQIENPKGYLKDLIKKESGKTYLNTLHNKNIARAADRRIVEKCKSFSTLSKFLQDNFPARTLIK